MTWFTAKPPFENEPYFYQRQLSFLQPAISVKRKNAADSG